MSRQSAGILLYRRSGGRIEVLLVHPGGPLWARRDLGAWSIPKGEYTAGEAPLEAARREFQEETGLPLPEGEAVDLAEVRLSSGKLIRAWAVEGDCDAGDLRSNLFTMEWPPRSGRTAQFPEVDRAGWFGIEEAGERIHPAQRAFLDRLAKAVGPTSRAEEAG